MVTANCDIFQNYGGTGDKHGWSKFLQSMRVVAKSLTDSSHKEVKKEDWLNGTGFI